MLKVDEKTYIEICQAVLKCARNCYDKGVQGFPAVESIEEEYKEAIDKIYHLLEENK